jgi:hypothetical protein
LKVSSASEAWSSRFRVPSGGSIRISVSVLAIWPISTAARRVNGLPSRAQPSHWNAKESNSPMDHSVS